MQEVVHELAVIGKNHNETIESVWMECVFLGYYGKLLGFESLTLAIPDIPPVVAQA